MAAEAGGRASRTQALDARLQRTRPRLQFAVLGAVLVTLWFGLNWIYQVVRKPTELFFPVSGVLYRLPDETWDTYESVFRKHSTSTITPAFLAALAQIEASGNPDRAHLLALVADAAAVRRVSACIQRCRHVPDHRRHVRGGAALLHPRSRRRRGRPVARYALVLVQQSVYAHGRLALGRAHLRVSRPASRAGARERADRQSHSAAEGESGSPDPSVRRRGRRALRAARPAPGCASALRRSRCARLPQPSAGYEDRVPASWQPIL